MQDKIILPGSTIGILGGGQLGRMIAIEGKKMGYHIICLDPTPGCPCGQVADDQIVAHFNDLAALVRLADRVDVLVYEFENIDVRTVKELSSQYYLPQQSHILAISQNRIEEKLYLQKAGYPVASFRIIRNPDDLEHGLAELGYPCLLKVASGGYDGKGQLVLENTGNTRNALELIQSANQEWVLEKKIVFNHEVSVIVARKAAGEMSVYPVAENIHHENILHMTVVPARVSSQVQMDAITLAKELAQDLQLVGLLAVEFFVTPDGLLINELAPRPHNSGHFTWDACWTSQYEQLIRAVCGLSLGSTQLLTPVIMVNILGADLPRVLKELPNFKGNYKIHLYGKNGNLNAKRKVGHLTIMTDRPDNEYDRIKTILPKV